MYDLIVLGGGPAGYFAAEQAGHSGMNVLLIEKRSLGGVCLNEGCIPSKSLLHSAKVYEYAKHSMDYGVSINGTTAIDHAAVIARKNKIVSTLVSGIRSLMRANKVEVVMGNGVLKNRNTVEVDGDLYEGKHILICTGSKPSIPPIPGLKEGLTNGFVLTNREILDLDTLPSHLVIIGGGVIGLEMASYYRSAGSKVTVIEMLPHIAGPCDREISAILQNNYQDKGVQFELNAKVTAVTDNCVLYEKDGTALSIKADKVLLSIGRRPVADDIGLDNLGVYCEGGAIVTDRYCQTNIAGVYAAGDVNGKSMLAHTAYREAQVAVNHMLGKIDIMRYNAIPSVIYTNPEVGAVGETEQSALEKDYDIEVAVQSMMFSGRYVAENVSGDGICKIIKDKKRGTLLGVHLIGNYASEIIYGAALMIEAEMRVDDIKELVFPHPTVSEIIKETIFKF